jgi:hypothetical protein
MFLKGDFIEIFGEMESLASIGVMFFDAVGIGPVGLLGPDFRTKIKEGFLKAEELLFEGKPLFGSGSGIVGDHDCPGLSPVFPGSSIGNQPVLLPAKFVKLPIFEGINGSEARGFHPDELLGVVVLLCQ